VARRFTSGSTSPRRATQGCVDGRRARSVADVGALTDVVDAAVALGGDAAAGAEGLPGGAPAAVVVPESGSGAVLEHAASAPVARAAST
jgi:hypothetical protein